jgi:hypothetical protein
VDYYNLDETSEKGILSAILPLDNYLMDLNSGQSFYRPVYMLALVLNQERTARAIQSVHACVLNAYYRHRFTYEHAERNSTAMSVDPLRALGWDIPRRGLTSVLEGVIAYLYMAARERNLEEGKELWESLTEEQTRILPRVAFEAIGDDLLSLASGSAARKLTPFEQWLQQDAEALLFLRLPQIPTARPLGTYPVASLNEYHHRLPSDRSQWKTAKVQPRPFPDYLREE